MQPNPHPPRLRLWALALSLASAASFASAQSASTDALVLKGRDVTESNLVNALEPQPEMARTRSLRIIRDGAGSVAAASAQRKPNASLLITFETNSYDLSPSAKQQLAIVAAALKNDRLADYSFNVEGHADPRGTPEGNMTLSQQRAESVRQFLIGAHGIAENRLHAEGKGDRDPLNRQYIAAPENRRVTIVTNVGLPASMQ